MDTGEEGRELIYIIGQKGPQGPQGIQGIQGPAGTGTGTGTNEIEIINGDTNEAYTNSLQNDTGSSILVLINFNNYFSPIGESLTYPLSQNQEIIFRINGNSKKTITRTCYFENENIILVDLIYANIIMEKDDTLTIYTNGALQIFFNYIILKGNVTTIT